MAASFDKECIERSAKPVLGEAQYNIVQVVNCEHWVRVPHARSFSSLPKFDPLIWTPGYTRSTRGLLKRRKPAIPNGI